MPFGLVELPTFVKGMSFAMFCFFFVCILLKIACYLQKRMAPCKAGVEASCREVHLRKASYAVILSLERINSLQLLAARTGGGAHPVEVCRQASATMPASRKQQSRKHWFVCCIPLWPSRLLGIEPLSRSDTIRVL